MTANVNQNEIKQLSQQIKAKVDEINLQKQKIEAFEEEKSVLQKEMSEL